MPRVEFVIRILVIVSILLSSFPSIPVSASSFRRPSYQTEEPPTTPTAEATATETAVPSAEPPSETDTPQAVPTETAIISPTDTSVLTPTAQLLTETPVATPVLSPTATGEVAATAALTPPIPLEATLEVNQAEHSGFQVYLPIIVKDDAPQADFTANPVIGPAPLRVTFINSSIQTTSYLWDFGDGTTSTALNPTHLYTQAGVFTVTFVVSDGVVSDTLTRGNYITPFLLGPPDSISVFSGGTIDLTSDLRGHWALEEASGQRLDNSGNGNHLADNNTVTVTTGQVRQAADLERNNDEYLSISHTLQSGLGITSSLTLVGWARLESANKTMVLASKYEYGLNNRGYRLTVEDDNRPSLTVSPNGTFTESYKLTTTTALTTNTWYHLGAVYDSQAQTLALYLDGAVIATRTVTYNQVYISTAPFVLGANIQNGGAVDHFDGRLDEWRLYGRALNQAEIQVLMSTTPPMVAFTATPLIGTVPLTVSFSKATTGTVTNYRWNFGDTLTSTVISPTHTYSQAGVYSVSLTATGPGGSASLTKTNYITATTNAVLADFSASPLTGTVPLTVTFANSSVNATAFIWNFGDSLTSPVISPTHTYTQAGVYTVTLAASNGTVTHTLTRTTYITASASGVQADFSALPSTGTAPLTVTFSNSSINATAFVWNFGDTLTSTVISPTHTYTQVGVYTVTLAASNSSVSNTLTRTSYIEVNSPATVDLGTDLRGYWALEESSGQRQDSSGQGNHLADNNTVTSATGQVRQAADLERNNDEYLSITHASQNGLAITGSLTLAGWARLESANKTMVLASKYEYGLNNRGYRLTVESDNRPSLTVSPNGTFTESYKLTTTTALTTNTWYHLGAVYDSQAQTLALYLDGAVIATRTVTYNQVYVSTAPFVLGANIQNGGAVDHFDGRLDEWRLYGRALGQGDIQGLLAATAPVANFGATPVSGNAPLTVTFVNSSTIATSYQWNFGDELTSTLIHPVHVYTQAGLYTVTLVARYSSVSNTLTRTHYISVTTGVVANFAASPLTGTVPLTVTFVNSSTNATAFGWHFGDSLTSTVVSPTHVYTQAGVYTVALTATGPDGSHTLTRTNYLTVSTTVGVMADFSAFPLNGSTPLLVQFLNNSIGASSYAWNFGDGLTSTLPSPTHTYTATGVYTVSLIASGPGGSDILTRTDYLTVYQPVNASFSATPLTGTMPLTVTFVNSSSGASSYLWDFGDSISSTVISPTHPYTQAGVYTVTLTASDGILTDTLTRTNYLTVTVPITREWQLITTTISPPISGEHAMVYDSTRKQVVLYGGNTNGWPYESATWEFDGTDWKLITTTLSPAARYGAELAYDPVRQVTVLFGGSDETDTALNQTWEYTNTNWTQVSITGTVPASRTYHSLASHPISGTIYLFGGNDEETYYNDLWHYNSDNGAWSEINVSGDSPPARTLAALTYDTNTNRLLLFGGRSVAGTLLADLWAFDPVAEIWQELDDGGGGNPPARMAHTLTYDPATGNVVLAGGATSEGVTLLGDTWHYSQNGWTEANPTTTLPARAYHQAVYGNNTIILFSNGEVWRYE